MSLSSFIRHPQLAPLLIQLVIAVEWIEAGVAKLQSGTFAATLPKTVEHFSQGNPHAWYVTSVLQLAGQHPNLFASLVQWGEVLTGLGLAIGALIALFKSTTNLGRSAAWLSFVALVGGLWMNLHFYLAAGWTSPSTGGLNVLMLGAELSLLLYWIQSTLPPLKKT